MTRSDESLTFVDGKDALAFVIVRPGASEGTVSVDAGSNGMSKEQGAYILAQIAQRWAAEAEAEQAEHDSPPGAGLSRDGQGALTDDASINTPAGEGE